MFTCVSAFAFEVSVWEEVCFAVSSRVSPLILHTQAKSVLTLYLFIPPTAIGSVPRFIRSHICAPIAFTTEIPQAQDQ